MIPYTLFSSEIIFDEIKFYLIVHNQNGYKIFIKFVQKNFPVLINSQNPFICNTKIQQFY